MAETVVQAPLAIGDVERETGIGFGVPADTKLTKYFIDSGLPGLAKIAESIEPKHAR
jgi:hypothetical protein